MKFSGNNNQRSRFTNINAYLGIKYKVKNYEGHDQRFHCK